MRMCRGTAAALEHNGEQQPKKRGAAAVAQAQVKVPALDRIIHERIRLGIVRRVIATSSSDEKLKRVRHLGADDTINYRTREDWEKAVLELTDGRGVDHVIEVGGTGTLTKSVKAVRVGGHIALIGALDMAGEFNPIPVFMKGIRVQGIFVGSREMFEGLNSMIESSKMVPAIDRIFGFEEARDALHYMESGSHFGKIVIKIGEK